MELTDLMQNRYSARGFSDVQLTDQQLSAVLEAGRIAPSAKNNQPWRFLVIQSAQGLAKVDAASRCRYGAPTAILVCFNTDESASTAAVEEFGWIDCSLAIMQMCLAAKDQGLDTCIVGAFDPAVAREQFNLPQNMVPCEFLMVGNATAEPAPRHFERKAIDEVVVKESF